ncbi:unnamed protein product [Hyaloperonospora brassicae]|uniref:Elicitin n=1 Tax=Hyaloperonospora brassicae TaxID=162125 RepID=A0AAV0UQF4_HYABA|nr:unnamed protein product [Hyaloperonospora brassicae]
MTGPNVVSTVLTALLVTSSSTPFLVAAQECPSNVSESFVATIDNSTFFSTCAEGATFNVSSVFDVLNFTAENLFVFCNSSTCLEPIHALMAPLDCNITYMGTLRNLSAEVSELHDVCHETLDAAEGSSGNERATESKDMSGHDHTGDSSSHSGSMASPASTAAVLSAVAVASIATLTALLA